MPTFVYPTNRELEEIVQDLIPRLEEGRKLLALMPYTFRDTAQVEWEQEDNYYGLMAVRGINGQPGNVAKVGAKKYVMKPGYYGEFHQVDEDEMTEARELGTLGDTINLDQLIVRRMKHLMVRRFNRMEDTISKFLRLGIFQNYSDSGAAVHTDRFTVTSRTPGTLWSTAATSTPLADLRSWKASGEFGTSSRFGKDSTLLGTTQTINYLLNNTNAGDLGGKRLGGGNSINSVGDLNTVLAGNDLPQLDEYNETADGTNPLIPHGKLIWVGTRPNGQRLGEFVGTRNINGGDSSNDGIYSKVVDNGDRAVPRQIQVHHGFNGGPAIYFPSAVQSLNVA